MKKYEYQNKQNSNYKIVLNGEYLNAIDVKQNGVYAEKSYNKKKQDKDEKHEWRAIQNPFSEYPEFVEPVMDKYHFKQQLSVCSKIMFIISVLERNFVWKMDKFVEPLDETRSSSSQVFSDTCSKNFEYKEEGRKREEKEEGYMFKIAFYGNSVVYSDICVGEFCTTNRRLLEAFDTPQNISNLKKKMMEYNLISPYKVNGKESYENGVKGKEYFWYKKNIELFKKFCKDNDVPKLIVPTQYERYLAAVRSGEVERLDDDMLEEVQIGRVKIFPINDDIVLTERLVVNSVYYKYSAIFDEFKATEKYLQENCYKEYKELSPRSRIKLTWATDEKGRKTYISKIGFRQTNSRCNATKDDTKTDVTTRQDVLKRYKLIDDYDVKSSVPRISSLLKTGKWISQETDMYEMIFWEYKRLNPVCKYEWCTGTRNLVKDAVLSNGFNTEGRCGVTISNTIGVPKGDEIREQIKESAILFHQAIENICGELSSEVFLAESYTYQNVTKELFEKGYFVFQVYDAWYVDKPIKRTEMDDMVEKYAMQFYNDYVCEEQSEISEIENPYEQYTVQELMSIRQDLCEQSFDCVDDENAFALITEEVKRIDETIQDKQDYACLK